MEMPNKIFNEFFSLKPAIGRHEEGEPDRDVDGQRRDAAALGTRLPRQRHQLRHRQNGQL